MSTGENDPIPLTVDDALAKWDAGEVVFSVSMGGLGPGYEMAIQGLAFELMREFRKIVNWESKDYITPISNPIIERCDKLPWGGFSGAQVGAAINLAAIVCRRGYRAALRDPVVHDRLIQVCKDDLFAAKGDE